MELLKQISSSLIAYKISVALQRKILSFLYQQRVVYFQITMLGPLKKKNEVGASTKFLVIF